jgi:uncharacterized protein YhhL (DUF1145 family)
MRYWWLWLIILLEIVAPFPAFLTLGAVYVLLARPPEFLRLVHDIYGIPRRGNAQDQPR